MPLEFMLLDVLIKDEYTYDLRGLDETEAENDIQS